MEQVVFLFPGAWGNGSEQEVLWWFEHPVSAIRAARPDSEVVPIKYVGRTLTEVIRNAFCQMHRHQRQGAEHTALAYSMGRIVLAGALEIASCVRVERAVHIAGVPDGGVPLARTIGIAMRSPLFFVRSFGGTVAPRGPVEVDVVLCGGKDPELAKELDGHIGPEPMYWKIAGLMLPGARQRTAPIAVPSLAITAGDDRICGGANYDEDNIVSSFCVKGAHHAFIRENGPELKAVWEDAAQFLVGA